VEFFLQALTQPQAEALMRWLAAGHLDTAGAHWLIAQHLAPYAYYRLRELQVLGQLLPEARELLHQSYLESAVQHRLQARELRQVISSLVEAGIEFVLMKGMALAYAAYPTPACRRQGDLDLWIRAEQCPTAMNTLEELGYEPHDKEDRPPALLTLYGGEQQMIGSLPGSGLVELQWPAIRGEWIRRTAHVDHAGIWERRVPVMIEDQPAFTLAPEDLLIHLCVHQAINHQFDNIWLRGLLDLHLLIQAQTPLWHVIVERARVWRVGVVVWTTLKLTKQFFGTPLPDELLNTLAPSSHQRWAIEQLCLDQAMLDMNPVGFRHRRFFIQIFIVDRARDVGYLLWRSLFPESSWLRARYNAESPGALWLARLSHPWRLLISARG
jgi:hypothetical protein